MGIGVKRDGCRLWSERRDGGRILRFAQDDRLHWRREGEAVQARREVVLWSSWGEGERWSWPRRERLRRGKLRWVAEREIGRVAGMCREELELGVGLAERALVGEAWTFRARA